MARRGAPRSSAAGRAPSSTRKSALRDCTGHGRRDCEREARGGGATGARRTAVVCVHEEDNRIHLRKVILPHAPSDLVAPQVKGPELDLGDRELLRCCGACGGWLSKGRPGERVTAPRQCALGCWVGLCCERRSSLSMCSSVVFPALSNPRKRIFAFLCARPKLLSMSHTQLMRNMAAAAEPVARGSTTR